MRVRYVNGAKSGCRQSSASANSNGVGSREMRPLRLRDTLSLHESGQITDYFTQKPARQRGAVIVTSDDELGVFQTDARQILQQCFRQVGKVGAVAAQTGFLLGQFLKELRPERLSKKIEHIPGTRITRPTLVSFKNCRQAILTSHLSNKGLELPGMT